jgi:hypothetical protein
LVPHSRAARWFRDQCQAPSFADYYLFLFAPRVDEESDQLRDIGQLSNIVEQGGTNTLSVSPPGPPVPRTSSAK